MLKVDIEREILKNILRAMKPGDEFELRFFAAITGKRSYKHKWHKETLASAISDVEKERGIKFLRHMGKSVEYPGPTKAKDEPDDSKEYTKLYNEAQTLLENLKKKANGGEKKRRGAPPKLKDKIPDWLSPKEAAKEYEMSIPDLLAAAEGGAARHHRFGPCPMMLQFPPKSLGGL